MKTVLIAFASIASLASCGEDDAKEPLGAIPNEQSTTRIVAVSSEESVPFDFEATLALINRINSGVSYEFFQSEWNELRSGLKRTDDINNLPEQKRSELWWAIEFMRACSRPEIFRDHNEEIIPILFSIDCPDLNQNLKEILIDSGQLSKENNANKAETATPRKPSD